MKVPIVLAAFGTTTSARQSYTFLDTQIRAAFPDHEVHWAFSSRMVRDFDQQRRGRKWKGPGELLEELRAKGFEWAVVQALHLLAGHEFYRLVAEVQACGIRTAMGLPLLSTPEDYGAFLEALAPKVDALKRDEAIILVGHGTDHPSWATYPALQNLLSGRFGQLVHIGVVEGHPSRPEVIARVVASGLKRVRLLPLMLVAGRHFQEDLAGPNDSWQTALKEAGLSVTLEAAGLLHYPGVIKIFQEHISNALDVIPGRDNLEGQERMEIPMSSHVFYRTVKVDGLSIFYREAGPKEAPTLLLLHGLPSSSRMFEPLFARLADRYHLVAPDYPGFGHSDWPDPKQFAYTFDHYAEILNHFTEALGLSRYTLYLQDYGGPVGFRMALAHPDRIKALIVQDAVAHNEGLGENWKPRRAFWADRAANEGTLRTNLLSLAATRTRHVGNDPHLDRYAPDLWTDEFAFLNKPGQADIQIDLFYDYRTNVDAYPKWQAWLRETQPRLLVIWGKYDLSFDLSEPEAYRRDVPDAQVHILDAGHFALDTAADEIAALVRGFIGSCR